MALSLSDLFRPLTRAEVEDSLLSIAASLGLPTTAWQPGGVARTILATVAQKVADMTAILDVIVRGGLLEYATDDWLTLLAREVYGVDRLPAEAAEGKVTFTNAQPSSYVLGIGEVIVAHATSGKTYRNIAAIEIPAGGSLANVDVRADEVGAESNASAGTITVMVTTLLGVTVTNPAAVLGADEETDADLRERCRDKLASLSPDGAAAAYEFIAKSTSSAVNRVRVIGDNRDGSVDVYLAGPSGTVASDVVDDVDDAIQAQTVPTAVTATVASATALSIAVTTEVWIQTAASLTNAEVIALVQARLAEYFRSIPIGGFEVGADPGKVFRDALLAQVEDVSPHIFHATMAAPAGDTTLTASQVATLGTVTVTVHQEG